MATFFGRLLPALLGLLAMSLPIAAASAGGSDTDRDGLSDGLEQKLLTQFTPRFMIARGDCAGSPAEFEPGLARPEIVQRDGTIYGQVFPAEARSGTMPTVEIHFYHLWDRDCGPHGHWLDTEHVALLVRASENNLESATWKALYWYAAAHEDTVCDVSQIARASALGAEERGATIYVSQGKHASYLSESLCQGGCGADRCEAAVPLKTTNVINLGEVGRPMNGAIFTASDEWPLQAKMSSTNFPPEVLARLDRMPAGEIAQFRSGKRPAQGAIAAGLVTGDAISDSGSDTSSAVAGAMDKAGGSTGDALSESTASTGNALQKSYRGTAHELKNWARHIGRALGAKPGGEPKDKQEDKPR